MPAEQHLALLHSFRLVLTLHHDLNSFKPRSWWRVQFCDFCDEYVIICNQLTDTLKTNWWILKKEGRSLVFSLSSISIPPIVFALRQKVGAEEFKYLHICIKNRLKWKSNTVAAYNKRMIWLHFSRTFDMCNKIMTIFYHFVVASTFVLSGLLGVDDNKQMRRLVLCLPANWTHLQLWWRVTLG